MVGIVSVCSVRIIFTTSSIALPFASATAKEGVLHTWHGVPDGAIPRFGCWPTDAEVFMGQPRMCFSPRARREGTWTETVLYSFRGPDGNSPDSSLILDSAENLYGTTAGGGAYSGGVAFELPPSPILPWTETVRTSLGTAATEAILSRNWSSIPLAIFTEPRSSEVPAVASRMAAPCIASVPVPQDGPRPFYTAFRFQRAGQTETCRLALS